MITKELMLKIYEATASRATELNLSNSGITELPPEIGQLTSLIDLYLGDNQLTTLPPEIGQLKNLQQLALGGNQLTTLPPEIGQLTCLMLLDLRSNQLVTLPPEIGQLKNLQRLILWQNKLADLSPEIGQLASLITLDLHSNQLADLPPEICQLTSLNALYLQGNQLADLPPEICQLTKLKQLALDNNPLPSLPYEIIQKGVEAIHQYCAGLCTGRHPLNEVKILLIGDGAAGKTSLVNRLLNISHDQHEDTTHGINIQGLHMQTSKQRIKVNIWDFGGQEIQHATHQFFLSKRSLYVLVLDGRKDERTEYWLRHVEAFGGDSPVLIVLNKMDSNPSFDVNRPFLREKYPSIREFFRISCKTGQGIAEFKEALRVELAKVGMLEIVWPASWFTVKRKLEQMDRPYISAEEYKGYCAEAGITEAQSRETLVDLLHDLGVAVHFKDFILDNMHVLEPIWVTNAVYKIITAQKMADSKGFLHLKHLSEILPQGDGEKLCYPPDTHPYIMHLMQKFELCYELDKDSVLIPQLLPVVEPKFTFEHKDSLRFALHYPDFLPPSVFPRFMVKAHNDIEGHLRWRTGVVLEDKSSGARAIVRTDIEARCINIWVMGKHRRAYLHYLRYLFAYINSSFEKIKVRELVPMPDDPHVSADYDTLLKYAGRGVDVYFPRGSNKEYSVSKLLNLVQPKNADELFVIPEKIGLKFDALESYMKTIRCVVDKKLAPQSSEINLTDLFRYLLVYEKRL